MTTEEENPRFLAYSSTLMSMGVDRQKRCVEVGMPKSRPPSLGVKLQACTAKSVSVEGEDRVHQ